MVLNCLKYQLRHLICPKQDESEKCDNLFQKLGEAIKSSYSSSGYVILTSNNFTLINSKEMTVGRGCNSLSDSSHGCNNNGKFAYIVFFSLSVLALISLGLVLVMKVKCINSHWVRYQQTGRFTFANEELVQQEHAERREMNNIEM
jgi:hypothetical protein